MFIGFLNPQGNFDPDDRYWTEHPDFGGQLVYVKELALALGRQGQSVDIITRQVIDPAWPGFEEREAFYPESDRVRILRLPAGPPHFVPKEQLWPVLHEWVEQIVRHYRSEGLAPDILTTHYADGGYSGALYAARTGVPFTFTGHSLGAQKMDKLLASRDNLGMLNKRFHFASRIAAERAAMNHAGHIITSTRQERFEQYGHSAYRGAVDPANEIKFRVIPPGVNLRIFRPEPASVDEVVQRRIAAAKARDISEERRQLPLIVASSRLDRKKNVSALVQAFLEDEALRRMANLALVVRGLDNPLAQRDALGRVESDILNEIATLIERYEALGEVTSFPLNSQAELAAGYRTIAAGRGLFALTSMYEPFGLAPLEAMACGLPVVVTRNGGPSESLQEEDQRYGLLVDPAVPADIARGLRHLLGSKAEWQTFHELGLRRVAGRYTWERTAEDYLVAAEDLLRGGGVIGNLPLPDVTKVTVDQLAHWYFGDTASDPGPGRDH